MLSPPSLEDLHVLRQFAITIKNGLRLVTEGHDEIVCLSPDRNMDKHKNAAMTPSGISTFPKQADTKVSFTYRLAYLLSSVYDMLLFRA